MENTNVLLKRLLLVSWLSIGQPYPGSVKVVAMNSITKIPVFGWILKFAEFIFLTQKWSKDEGRFSESLISLREYKKQTGCSFVIVLFPEGALLEKDNLLKSHDCAKKNNLPLFQNVLLPILRGLREIVPLLRNLIDVVVDLTVMFSPERPSISDVLAGNSS